MEALEAKRADSVYDQDRGWWLDAARIKEAIEQQPAPQRSVHYKFGDAALHILCDTQRLLDMFERLYGDCALAVPVESERAVVRCVVRRGGNPPFLLLSFLEGAPQDAASAFLPIRGTRVWNSPLPGWRLAGSTGQPILAACGAHVLINLKQAWEHLPVEYLVNATLTAQPELVAVHGASLCIGGGGLILAGPSESGKTTTSLTLAARGFDLLGDEVALIRFASNEIVPFRRTANLRPGPRAAELSTAVERLARMRTLADEDGTMALRIGALFPQSSACAVPLQAIFFLGGFAERPSLTTFRPAHSDSDAFSVLAGNEIATLWGLPLERRALRLMAVRRLLDRFPSWLLRVGSPDETADLIESAMEGLGC